MAPKPDPKPKTTPKTAKSRLDFATVAGIGLALLGIVGGLLLEKGDIADIAQLTAAMIVLGGTAGAVLVTTPMSVALRALKGLPAIFFEDTGGGAEIAAKLIHFASESRKNGIVSLEKEVSSVPDPFLRKAMSLAIDGADLQDLRRMMEVDIGVLEQNGEAEAKVWEAAGGYAPTIGIIGAALGLIQVMKHLEDLRVVGHGIAGAFVATVYGVGCANIFFLPIASKLRARLRQTLLMREMILEGVAGIAQGMNPTLVRIKLESFFPDKPESKKKDAAAPKGAPAPSTRAKEAA